MNIEIVEKEIGPVLEVEFRSTIFGMPGAMGSGFKMIYNFMKGKGVEPKEPPYARYPEINWEQATRSGPVNFIRMFFKKWHFFTGFPAGQRMDGDGSIQANHLGRRKYISCLFIGPYRDVGKAYKAMLEFARAKGLETEPWCLEVYLNDPRESGQATAETVCMIPVR